METLDAVRDYMSNLKNEQFKSPLKEVIKLNGGLANFVYRLKFEDGSTAVLKYYPAFLAFDRTLAMSQKRSIVEKEALRILGDHELLRDSRIRVAKLLYFDNINYVIIMQDAGEHTKTLFEFVKKEAPHAHANEIIDLFAKELAQFSKFLREKSGITPATHKEPFANETGWSILQSYMIPVYTNEAKSFNLEKECAVHLARANAVLQEPSGDDGYFMFGDLWPSKCDCV